jgi:hypothetical protein
VGWNTTFLKLLYFREELKLLNLEFILANLLEMLLVPLGTRKHLKISDINNTNQ